jgi:triacylglycerol esterase/lipase EstA (alpha/beta hydrolase family)
LIKKLPLLIFALAISNFSLAQRTIPNPIILVHGWTGSDETWVEFTNYLEKQAKLTIERNSLNYNLNCDYNLNFSNKYSDVCDANYGQIGNKDVYIINFNAGHQSNQAAIVKQGYALKFAIDKVLAATGADNVVLLGHSMGGLAIREYLQNSANWQSDGQHHVAKLITIGTPHKGSNISGNGLLIFARKDENSEAVRDLRESYIYSSCLRSGQPINCPGVYLWGGQETRDWMKTNIYGGSNFYNIDVNCNGSSGEYVTGLNQKSINTNLDFACIIGGPNNTDGIVSTYSQNLNTLYAGLNAELFFYNCNGDFSCHTNEPKKALTEMVRALDEPKTYLTKIKFGNSYKGFFTLQSNSNQIDTDEYSISVPQKGVISYSAGQVTASNAVLTLKKANGQVVFSGNFSTSLNDKIIVESGNYLVSISGNSLGSWATYNFSLGFCPLPPTMQINISGNPTFCSGDSLQINTTLGYQNYEWLKDEIPQSKDFNHNAIYAKSSGVYRVHGISCGVLFNSVNNIVTTVKESPVIPKLLVQTFPDSFLITSSSFNHHNWFLSNQLIENSNGQTIVPAQIGDYYATVDSAGCFSKSEKINIYIPTPQIKLNGNSTFCEGDSVTLELEKGFGKYEFYSENDTLIQTANEFSISKTGIYLVSTYRGSIKSDYSDSIKIIVKPNPITPEISYANGYLISSSENNNQWYLNGNILLDSTENKINILGFGNYSVKVELDGCYSESNFQLITSTDIKNKNTAYKIYPNPNNGRFWIENLGRTNWLNIRIFDITGKTFYYSDFSKKSISKFINVGINSGVFFVQIQDNLGTTTLKLVRE